MNEIERLFRETYESVVNTGIIVKTKWNEYEIVGEEDSLLQGYAKVKWISGRDKVYYNSHFAIEEQYEISKYRADFIIGGNINHIGFTMAIEIDGHDWHEKTKSQAIKDKKREREIIKNNINMIRFSASEVYSNAKYCVKESIICFLALYETIVISTGEG